MNKKEFVPLLENLFENVNRNGQTRHSQKIIKPHQLKNSGTIKVYEMEHLQDHMPEITVIEENGQVSQIEFKCPCGCQAVVKLLPEELTDGLSSN